MRIKAHNSHIQICLVSSWRPFVPNFAFVSVKSPAEKLISTPRGLCYRFLKSSEGHINTRRVTFKAPFVVPPFNEGQVKSAWQAYISSHLGMGGLRKESKNIFSELSKFTETLLNNSISYTLLYIYCTWRRIYLLLTEYAWLLRENKLT